MPSGGRWDGLEAGRGISGLRQEPYQRTLTTGFQSYEQRSQEEENTVTGGEGSL